MKENLANATLTCNSESESSKQCMENCVSPAQFVRSRDEPDPEPVSDRFTYVANLCFSFGCMMVAPLVLPVAYVTRKMTKQERDGVGFPAIMKEIESLVNFDLFDVPKAFDDVASSDPGATASGFNMLSHVKHAERPGSEEYKGRAVVRGDDVKVMSTGNKAKIPEGVEVGQVAALEEVRAVAGHSTVRYISS